VKKMEIHTKIWERATRRYEGFTERDLDHMVLGFVLGAAVVLLLATWAYHG